MTLNRSKRKHKKKKIKRQRRAKKPKRRKTKKHENTKKRAFQLSVIFSFFGGCPNFPFLTTWPKKRAPKKHNKNRGFSNPFLENSFASRDGHFWTKKTKSRNSSYHCWGAFFFSFNNKNTKISWNPYFYSVLANLKKIISNFQLKTQKIENPILALFLKKGYF